MLQECYKGDKTLIFNKFLKNKKIKSVIKNLKLKMFLIGNTKNIKCFEKKHFLKNNLKSI